jgi:MoxR-like ATPase
MSRALKAIAITVQANESALAIGDPGVGKTAMLTQLGQALGRHVEVITGTTAEPQDLGINVIQPDGDLKVAPPPWLRRLLRASGEGKPTLLIIDELSCATPAMQSGFLRMVQERVVGDTPLPANCAIVAIMNPPEVAANGTDLAAPLANRFPHIEWSFDHSAWIAWLLSNGTATPDFPRLPDDWRDMIGQQRILVAGFNKAKTTAALQMPKTDLERGKAWASPRTWDMAARLRAASIAAGAGKDTEIALTAGCIGNGLGIEYCNYLDNLDLPDTEELLATPESFKVPERGVCCCRQYD